MNSKGWKKRADGYWKMYYLNLTNPIEAHKWLLKAKNAEINYMSKFSEEMKEYD
jgi:hypothetical protein